MRQPRETELKFLAAPEDLERIAKAEFLASAEHLCSASIRTSYFDTPDRDFRKHGLLVRVRNFGDHWIQSVKQASGVERFESEREIDEPSPSLRLPGDLPPSCGVTCADNLKEQFASQVQRKTFLLAASGAVIEIAFDRGDIVTPDGKIQQISEIELELKDGDPAGLFGLARQLAENAPVSFSLLSKGERGFLLAEKQSGLPHKASKVHLSRELSVAQSFAAIGRMLLHDFMLNLSPPPPASVRVSDQILDVETVHQTRVAIRRLRAAMNFFRPCVEDQEFAQLKDGLRWISGLLGAARNFDVWQEETLGRKVASLKVAEGYRELSAAMEEKRLHSHQELTEAIGSLRLRLLILDLAIWLEAGEWRSTGKPADMTPLIDFVKPRMRAAARKLRRQGRNFATLGKEQQHALRIRAKKLRYCIEFFLDLFETSRGRRRAKKLLRALEDLQASIGKMHDDDSLGDFLADAFVGGRHDRERRLSPTAAFAAGRLCASHPRRKKLERKAAKGFAKFAGTRISV
ncbi:CYTH and CHAD domain-containing protein [Methylocapsa palsarum]|uniref:Inorganic triphosphatase YgiF, contains CYTH and CHAD domains n=1 Tax=Methylocapsa palsarum TaxID=1612308 RepID=A0A1I3WU39_9HYPH|nr:CYTH and CHAD domain-containing protein [Methylocapsa palsarum]SFK10669.1 Inorganic triphosphatase YgiF, contains CYTH and CHAD domains [Methylocapsa palsarum]